MCQVSDIKRLNKIERDLEIHARKTIRVPMTRENVLVDHLPGVHSSGQSSPKHASIFEKQFDERNSIVKALNQLPADVLREPNDFKTEPSINEIILNTKITPNSYSDHNETNAQNGKLVILFMTA